MQINPFGLPFSAGTQSAQTIGGSGLGFVDALGVAIEGGAPQLMRLTASATPPARFNPQLAQTLLAQAQLDTQAMPAVVTLPGIEQPTSLSQLMATAAKLPAGDAPPLAEPVTQPATTPSETRAAMPATTPAETPVSASVETLADPESEPAPVAVEAAPKAVPPQSSAPQSAVAPAPIAMDPEADASPEAPKPTEAASAKPQKGVRAHTVAPDADPAQPADAEPAVPAELLAVAPQQIAQPQSAPREAATPQTGNGTASVKKVAPAGAPAEANAQATTAATPDFARAVAARADSGGSDTKPDGQAQPEMQLAAAPAKPDAAAPQFPQPTQATAAADPARATAAAAPAPAEPVIEARTGHLGQSLGVEIARKVELGEETLRIRLNPIELGRIEVTLAFDDKGSLQATVRTESAQAMDLLRQDAPDLARTLDQAGVRTDAQSFRFENRGGDSGGQQAQQQHSQNRGQFASSDDDAAAAEPIYRPVRSDGQVDLLA